MILVEDYIAKFFEERPAHTQENIDKMIRLLKQAESELRNRALKINPLGQCAAPPAGWTCSRVAGHEGPCAASPIGSGHPEGEDLCYGCGHKEDEHPTEVGCQEWHRGGGIR